MRFLACKRPVKRFVNEILYKSEAVEPCNLYKKTVLERLFTGWLVNDPGPSILSWKPRWSPTLPLGASVEPASQLSLDRE